MPIKVLYDDRGFRMNVGGVPRYFTEIIKRFPPDIQWKIGAVSTENIYLASEPFNVPLSRPEYSRDDFVADYLGGHYVHGLDRLWCFLRQNMPALIHAKTSEYRRNDRYLKKLLAESDFDIVHLTVPHDYAYNWSEIVGEHKLVVTIHDLIPELLLGDVKVRQNRAKILERADKVVADSNFTKQKIIEEYAVDESKIVVIHLGHLDFSDQDSSQVFEGKKYILYVGKRNPYKKFDFFVHAVAPLLKEKGDLHLACTGDRFNDDEEELLRQEGVRDKVLHAFVPEKSMQSLYANATAFVYSSMMEGFGIPTLDAFSAGCPVVLANASCFPEVAGDAALYYDLGDENGLRSCIKRLMQDSKLRNKMIERGRKRVAEFSWERASSKMVEVYRSLV